MKKEKEFERRWDALFWAFVIRIQFNTTLEMLEKEEQVEKEIKQLYRYLKNIVIRTNRYHHMTSPIPNIDELFLNVSQYQTIEQFHHAYIKEALTSFGNDAFEIIKKRDEALKEEIQYLFADNHEPSIETLSDHDPLLKKSK